MSWLLHHVNVCVPDMKDGRSFYETVFGMKNLTFPFVDEAHRGVFEHDRVSLFDDGLRQIHMCRPQGNIGALNQLFINPMLDGHVAINVEDIEVIRDRLRKRNRYFADADQWAFRGYHQLYLYDPAMNILEVNQYHGRFQDPDDSTNPPNPREINQPFDPESGAGTHEGEDWWRLHHATLPVQNLDACAEFYAGVFDMVRPEFEGSSSPAGRIGMSTDDPGLMFYSDGADYFLLATQSGARAVDNEMFIDPVLHGSFGITVADIDRVRDNMKRNDIFFIEPRRWHAHVQNPIYTFDPGMNVIEIVDSEHAKTAN